MNLLPQLPSARVRRNEHGFETEWIPTFTPLFTMLGGLAPLMNMMSGHFFPLVFFYLALVEYVVRFFPIQRAKWDDSSLQLLGPVEATWRWDAIDSLGFSDRNRLQIVVAGEKHWVDAPRTQAARDALLQRWKAHLTQEDQPLPTVSPRWDTRWEAKTAWVHFRERAAAPWRSPLRPALWMAFVASFLPYLVVQLPVDPRTTVLLGALAVLAAFLLPLVVALPAVLSSLKKGAVSIDQHRLTLKPVERPERSFTWDTITHLEHDELELRVRTEEGEYTYDFTALPVDQTRGLLHELERRWRARHGVGGEQDLDAMRRLQHVHQRV